MPVIATDVRETRESARRIRFESTGLISANNVQTAIEQLSSPLNPSPRIVTASPDAISILDSVIYVNIASSAVVTLPISSGRNNLPLTIIDVSGNASVNNISIVPAGSETINAIYTNGSPLLINSDYGGFILKPVTGGWVIQP